MRHLVSVIFILFVVNSCTTIQAQVCDPTGNLFIISNYDGGILTIDVDVNIPNLVIAISSYEPIQVDIQGPFLSNVSQVIYAGFNSIQGNNNCNQGNFETQITGVDPSIISISPPQNPPSVGYNPVHGNGNSQMIGTSGVCDTTINAGGGNTPDEIVYYFESTTSSQLYAHFTQYNCWQNDVIQLSNGGTCCIEPPQPEGCDPNGNLVVFSNYEGGILDIVVDQNIPNLKIGIVSYEATEVNITGPFIGNITGVIYAGFDAPSSNCGTTIDETTIAGISSSLVTIYSITDGNIPIANYLGEPLPGIDIPLVNCITGAEGGCNTSNDGGGNSAPQIVQFFLSEFGAGTSLYFHNNLYGCFQSPYALSNGGNCCLINTGTPVNPIYEQGATYNFIQEEEYSLCNGPLSLDLSNYPVLFQPPTYPGYVWSDGTQGPLITISEPGVYSFTAGDYCHFDASNLLTDTIIVLACCTEPTAPIVIGDLTYCENDNISPLSIQPPLAELYSWYADAALNNEISNGSTFTPSNLALGNNVFYVTATENNCESVATSVVLVLEPNPNVNIVSSSGNFICEDSTTNLSVLFNNADASIEWSTGESTITIAVNTAGIYSANVTLNGCSGSDSIEIENAPVPEVNINGPLESCKDVPLSFTASGANSYVWSTGEVTSSISIIATSDTLISVVGTSNGCSNEDEIFLSISNGPDLQTDSVLVLNLGEPLTINAVTDGTFVSWLPQGIVACDTCSTTIVESETDLLLYASAQSENGCVTFDTLRIEVDNSCNQLFIPTAFSPNNFEPNEVFCIESNCIKNMNFYIFDRWGNRVYFSNDSNECWNGGINGYYVPDGVYNWRMTGTFLNGDLIDRAGHVLVIR